jgi:hypothetical protein
MPFPFQSLPLELRRLVYADLLPVRATRMWIRLEGALTMRANRYVHTALLLVSKSFLDELLIVLATEREVCVETSSCRDMGYRLHDGWFRHHTRGTKRLSIHIHDKHYRDSKALWRDYSRKPAWTVITEDVSTVIKASIDSSLGSLNVSVQLPDEQAAQHFLDYFDESADAALGNSRSIANYIDKWNNLACKQLICTLDRDCGQLCVQITAKSPLRLVRGGLLM